ncbi:hypothetical protein VP06_10535 [Methylobacterium aquaticum]|jgi:hypothetical protein|uniref:HTH cro/C1-type domain-containing protein n=1 Tax=Methylobacterium aquaticum TaxID=270351 RepID=A0A0J6SLX2_9HYPH|nr:hypothetical protein VP06_10535 [Methylobacterium aquaticum]
MSEASPVRHEPAPAAEAPAERPIDVIARIGRAMYGPLWIGKLAADNGLSHQSVRRWLAGQGSPTAFDFRLVKLIAREHAARVMRAVGDETP